MLGKPPIDPLEKLSAVRSQTLLGHNLRQSCFHAGTIDDRHQSFVWDIKILVHGVRKLLDDPGQVVNAYIEDDVRIEIEALLLHHGQPAQRAVAAYREIQNFIPAIPPTDVTAIQLVFNEVLVGFAILDADADGMRGAEQSNT